MGKSILLDMSWFKGSVFGRHPQTTNPVQTDLVAK
jgi:hypothetical protein